MKQVLVIDDDEAVRETIAAVIGLAGYRCRRVANGIEALKLLRSGKKFDLVTTDIENPGSNDHGEA